MRFNPKSEDELAMVLPKGDYDAEVISAEDKVSQKTGNEMIELVVKVHGPQKTVSVKDWLISSDDAAWKLHSFCKSAGLLDAYESGDLQASDLQGVSVRVRLDIEEQEGFPDKNRVKSYLVPKSATKPSPKKNLAQEPAKPRATVPPSSPPTDGDDIPF